LGSVPARAEPSQLRSAAVTFSTFDASASADGVRVGVLVPGAPLTSQLVDAGGPTAQAVLNGLGKSQAFASLPYPGDAALTLPNTVFPLVGLPEPPPYPLIARSDSTTSPQASVNQPGVSMTAKSASRSSSASLAAGGVSGANGLAATTANAATTADDARGEVLSTAQSTADVINVQGVLRIGHTRAKASATRPADGAVRTDSAFEADAVTIAGVSAAVTDKGIVLPGSTAPVPDTSGLSPVLDAAGISMRFLTPIKQADGVMSPGLAVSVKAPGLNGDVVVTYTFGRAAASASGVAAGVPAVPVIGVVAGEASPPAAAAAAAPVAGAGASGPPANVTSPLPAAVPGPSASLRPAPAVASHGPAAVTALPAASTMSSASVYLLLVLGAAVIATGMVLIRLLGVRLAWT
jgi:hypothetical protein